MVAVIIVVLSGDTFSRVLGFPDIATERSDVVAVLAVYRGSHTSSSSFHRAICGLSLQSVN